MKPLSYEGIIANAEVTLLPIERKLLSPRKVNRNATNSRLVRSAVVKVSEARGLPGNIGAFCEVWVKKRKVVRTTTKWNDASPFWGDEVKVDLSPSESHITVNLCREPKAGRRTLKGTSRAAFNEKEKSIGTLRLEVRSLEGWHRVLSSKSKKQREKPLEYSIRLAIKYEELIILPSQSYGDMIKLLLLGDYPVISFLSDINEIKPKARVDLAEALAVIAEARGVGPKMLSSLISKEIEKTKTKQVLFRGNSIGTKSFDYYMKLVGQHWLKSLNPVIEMVKHSYDLTCELISSKLSASDDVENNAKLLTTWVKKTAERIFTTVNECPAAMRQIFATMNTAVKKQFPGDDEVLYTAISGFIFLRFFIPAIMTPKLFGLMDNFVDGNVNRTFVLMATVLQKLGNLQEFESREAHLDKLNPFIREHVPNLKAFIDTLCDFNPEETYPPSAMDPESLDVDKAAAQLVGVIMDEEYSNFMKPTSDDDTIAEFLNCVKKIHEEQLIDGQRRKEEQERISQTAFIDDVYDSEFSEPETEEVESQPEESLTNTNPEDSGTDKIKKNRDTDKSADKSAERSAEKSVEKSVERSMEKSTDSLSAEIEPKRKSRERSLDSKRKKRVSKGSQKPPLKRQSRRTKQVFSSQDEIEDLTVKSVADMTRSHSSKTSESSTRSPRKSNPARPLLKKRSVDRKNDHVISTASSSPPPTPRSEDSDEVPPPVQPSPKLNLKNGRNRPHHHPVLSNQIGLYSRHYPPSGLSLQRTRSRSVSSVNEATISTNFNTNDGGTKNDPDVDNLLADLRLGTGQSFVNPIYMLHKQQQYNQQLQQQLHQKHFKTSDLSSQTIGKHNNYPYQNLYYTSRNHNITQTLPRLQPSTRPPIPSALVGASNSSSNRPTLTTSSMSRTIGGAHVPTRPLLRSTTQPYSGSTNVSAPYYGTNNMNVHISTSGSAKIPKSSSTKPVVLLSGSASTSVSPTSQDREPNMNESKTKQISDVSQYICCRCKRALVDGINVGSRFYHINCFTCSNCQIGLENQTFYDVDNQVFCKDCFQNLRKV